MGCSEFYQSNAKLFQWILKNSAELVFVIALVQPAVIFNVFAHHLNTLESKPTIMCGA
jgi:hypothetical protein